MRLVIIGAGATGRNLAARLCEMGHDLVVVDQNAQRLARTEEQLDILTVEGNGASPDVLDAAQVDKADLLIAVSNKDEVNILACQYAHIVGVPHTVARVANPALLRSDRFDLAKLGVSLAISHKEETAAEILNILRHPGAIELVDLLDSKLQVCGVRLVPGSPLLEGAVSDLAQVPVMGRVRLIALMRGDNLEIPRGDTRCMAGDDIYVALCPGELAEFLDWAVPNRKPYSKIVLSGGGDLGLEVARRLEQEGLPGVIVERASARAGVCSDSLSKVLVLCGDASSKETLVEAGLGEGAAYIAITGDEELNIISCMLAQKMGAALTLAQVAKPEYAPIVRDLRLLDRVVSPHLSMIKAILHFVRGRHVRSTALLHRVPGELLHVAVKPRHKWAGHRINELKLPVGCVIAAVLRDGEVQVATGSVEILEGDELVLFVHPDVVGKIQGLFKS
jgi:trk system potassium uptake protein TrkA